MGLCISPDNGIPEENASFRCFVEQVASRGKVMVECIESDEFGRKKGSRERWVLEIKAWSCLVLRIVRYGFESSDRSEWIWKIIVSSFQALYC